MGGKSVTVGVLALQGNVSEHIDAFAAAFRQRGSGEASVIEVRSPADLSGCAALAIPGGESTTISRLIDRNGLYEPIRTFPGGIFATCAGMVLMATLVADPRVHTLGLMDMTVDRNAFGRQKESFEADITVAGLDGGPFHAIFIRAPVVTSAGTGVRVLSSLDQGIVAAEKGRYMALAFHPELGGDLRLHERFLRNLGI
ncbi:MAG: pyridoxal 5'-phosphate synthase glutaminase subunit PdxT [Methanoregula sp.]|uniref:pyridoxal 5'-phosphate synthase glutaminase subunit PdxT n=1 Tax=Methanoregula sp. TaxID=2052170 RepID=UPI003C540A4B